MKIIGNTVGMGLPKPNLMQTDPTKGDYVHGKEEFLKQINGGATDEQIAKVIEEYLSKNPVGVPSGGTTGQFLRKKSDANGDVEWADFEIPKEYGLVTYDQDKTITIT